MDPYFPSSSRFGIEGDKTDPDQKTPDMGKPGHSTSKTDVEHLKEKPKAKDKEGRNGDDSDKQEEENQGQNPCSWIENQVCSQNSCDGSTRSHYRDLRIGIENDMGQACSQARKKIEKDESERPQEILNVITEYPEIEHVPEKVEKAPVEEHGSDQGQSRGNPRNSTKRGEMGDLIRNGSHLKHIILQSMGRERLIEKNQDVQANKK
jgi:hypothetical protein